MGTRPTKAKDNVFCKARLEAALYNDKLKSRAGAAEALGYASESTIADWELGSNYVKRTNEEESKDIPKETESTDEVNASTDSESLGENADADMKPKEAAEVYTGIAGAVARLQEWSDKANDKNFATPVIEHLIKRCEESESLSNDICQLHKTWEKCLDYIYRQAKKQATKNRAVIRSDVVYEWAEDYFHLDDKAAEEKKAKEEAERKKKAAERAQQNKSAGSKTGKAAKPETSSAQKKADAADTKLQPKPKKNELDGQMDLFSMLEL